MHNKFASVDPCSQFGDSAVDNPFVSSGNLIIVCGLTFVLQGTFALTIYLLFDDILVWNTLRLNELKINLIGHCL